MANETKSFRSAMLGFDRNEVIDYIEAMARERREEVEAHRQAAAILRNERDEARKSAAELSEQIRLLRDDTATVARQNEELIAKRILCDELSERLSQVNTELIAAKDQIEKQQQMIQDYEEEGLVIGRAKTRAADMELMAYKRAEAIELETMRNTEKARAVLKRLVVDTKGKYALSRGEAESVAYGVLQELKRLVDWFSEFPRMFDGIEEKLDSMYAPEKPKIQTFVPRRFDEDENAEPQSDTQQTTDAAADNNEEPTDN